MTLPCQTPPQLPFFLAQTNLGISIIAGFQAHGPIRSLVHQTSILLLQHSSIVDFMLPTPFGSHQASKCCRDMSSCYKLILSWWLIVYKSTSITTLLILLTLVVVSQFWQWCLDFGLIVASGLPGRASQRTVTVAGQCCPH